MYNMNRRLNTIEKKLMHGNESRIIPPIIVSQCSRNPTVEDENKLGPHKTWLTYQKQLQAQEKANSEYLKDHPGCLPKAIFIELDIETEYRARLSNGA